MYIVKEISNCCSFELSIHQSSKKNGGGGGGGNVLPFSHANQHNRMISEGSCDTEDWSNDAENAALRHRKKKIGYTLKSVTI